MHVQKKKNWQHFCWCGAVIFNSSCEVYYCVFVRVAKCLHTFAGWHRKVHWRYMRRLGMLIPTVGLLSRYELQLSSLSRLAVCFFISRLCRCICDEVGIYTLLYSCYSCLLGCVGIWLCLQSKSSFIPNPVKPSSNWNFCLISGFTVFPCDTVTGHPVPYGPLSC